MKEALAAPLGDLIASIGEGVGEAQAALDEGTLRQTLDLYNKNPDDQDKIVQLLRQIGYQPTQYVIPEVKAKAKISISFSQKAFNSLTPNNRLFAPRVMAAPINATNSNTYGLDINASAEIEFKIVPVPPSEASLIRYLPDLEDKTLPEAIGILNEYGFQYEIKTKDISGEWEIDTEFEDENDLEVFEVFVKNTKATNNRIISVNEIITLHCIQKP